MGECSTPGCVNRQIALGLCPGCNGRKRRADMRAADVRCCVEGCEKTGYVQGMCDMHYARLRLKGDIGSPEPFAGKGWIDDQGYRCLSRWPNNHVLEHRVVMEEVLGRELLPGENVHHKNGRRADNRPENLELWVTPQPYGQRPEDLVAWVIDHYRALVEAALQ